MQLEFHRKVEKSEKAVPINFYESVELYQTLYSQGAPVKRSGLVRIDNIEFHMLFNNVLYNLKKNEICE